MYLHEPFVSSQCTSDVGAFSPTRGFRAKEDEAHHNDGRQACRSHHQSPVQASDPGFIWYVVKSKVCCITYKYAKRCHQLVWLSWEVIWKTRSHAGKQSEMEGLRILRRLGSQDSFKRSLYISKESLVYCLRNATYPSTFAIAWPRHHEFAADYILQHR